MISTDDEKYLNSTDIDTQPIHQFLLNALTLKLKGNQNHYQHLVSTLTSKQDSEMLFRLYLSLSCHISLVTKNPDSYRELIQSIYSYDWKSETKVNIALLNLLGSIVSSNVTFLGPTFQFIISSFLPPLNLYIIQSNDKIINELEKNQYYQRLHRALKHLLTTVPAGRSELFPLLIQNFPHKTCDLLWLESYTTQLLFITEYFPGIQEQILDLLFQKSLDLDVSIIIEESGEVKINEEIQPVDADQSIFLLDEVEPPKLLGFRYLITENHRISDEVAQSADKLDILLVLMIEYLILQIQKQKVEVMNYLFQHLLNIFEDKILVTHRSKFVQFVLFFLSGNTSESLRFGDIFVNRLKVIFLDQSNANLKRQCSIMYLSSFISRANFLSSRIIR